MKKYLITGGAGFIGSALAARLINDNNEVYLVDNLSTGLKENIPENSSFFEHDIAEPLPAELANIDFDTVFHLAAQTSGEKSFYIPVEDVKTNVLGTTNIIEFCKEKRISRLVNMSTMSIYGKPEGDIVSELTQPVPSSIYGSTKLAAENICNNLCKYYGINHTNIRLFNAYGPGQNLDNLKQGMVSIYLAHFLKYDKLEVKGSLDRFRDLIYIDDVVEALLISENKERTYGETINLGRGHKVHVNEMIDILKNEMAMPDFPVEITESTPGDIKGIIADTTKMKKILDWYPDIDEFQGIKIMVSMYKDTSNE
jgi:UDP-glucose 4-epimerase